MSQATKSHTTNVVNFKPAPVAPALSAEQAQTLWELCALAAYHPSGFTHTRKMTAVTRFIADTAGPDAVAACLASADIRERAYVTRKR